MIDISLGSGNELFAALLLEMFVQFVAPFVMVFSISLAVLLKVLGGKDISGGFYVGSRSKRLVISVAVAAILGYLSLRLVNIPYIPYVKVGNYSLLPIVALSLLFALVFFITLVISLSRNGRNAGHRLALGSRFGRPLLIAFATSFIVVLASAISIALLTSAG